MDVHSHRIASFIFLFSLESGYNSLYNRISILTIGEWSLKYIFFKGMRSFSVDITLTLCLCLLFSIGSVFLDDWTSSSCIKEPADNWCIPIHELKNEWNVHVHSQMETLSMTIEWRWRRRHSKLVRYHLLPIYT